MKKKEIQELKRKPIGELLNLIKENSEKLRAFKFDLAAGKVKDITGIREMRKNLARMKTFVHDAERNHQ